MKKKAERTAAFMLAFGFLLGVKDGHMALWVDDDPQPEHIFSVQVTSLPPVDQVMLRRGIRVENETQLMMLLEDYLP